MPNDDSCCRPSCGIAYSGVVRQSLAVINPKPFIIVRFKTMGHVIDTRTHRELFRTRTELPKSSLVFSPLFAQNPGIKVRCPPRPPCPLLQYCQSQTISNFNAWPVYLEHMTDIQPIWSCPIFKVPSCTSYSEVSVFWRLLLIERKLGCRYCPMRQLPKTVRPEGNQ